MHANPNQPMRSPSASSASDVAAASRRGRRFSFASPLEEIRDEMDRLWSEFTATPFAFGPLVEWTAGGEGGRGFPATAAGFPAVNVSEAADKVVIEAELPGVTPTDLDVSVAGDEVVIKGRRPAREEPAAAKGGEQPIWLRRERGTGDFERRIELPVTIDPSKIEATLTDGVLTLHCTKAAECQPHKIEIRS